MVTSSAPVQITQSTLLVENSVV